MMGPVYDKDSIVPVNEAAREECLSLAHKGKRRHHVEFPVFRLHGPLINVVIDPYKYSKHHPLGIGHKYCC